MVEFSFDPLAYRLAPVFARTTRREDTMNEYVKIVCDIVDEMDLRLLDDEYTTPQQRAQRVIAELNRRTTPEWRSDAALEARRWLALQDGIGEQEAFRNDSFSIYIAAVMQLHEEMQSETVKIIEDKGAKPAATPCPPKNA